MWCKVQFLCLSLPNQFHLCKEIANLIGQKVSDHQVGGTEQGVDEGTHEPLLFYIAPL